MAMELIANLVYSYMIAMEPFNIAIATAEFPRSDAYFSSLKTFPHSKGGVANLKLSRYIYGRE